MTSTRLQDDLLKDFKEQKKMIYEQVELLDPLGTSLRKPAAQRLISKGFMIFSEVICYLLAAGIIAFMFFMDKIYPFYILADLRFKSEFRSMGWINIQAFVFAIYAVFGLVAVLFYALGRSSRAIRQKNDILNLAGKSIKEIVGQHLHRKASIDTIEQRHFRELPNEHLEEGVVKVNEVPNPGYDE
ncbi:MAG: hypothetical protein H6550_06955 [Chitinophagales bacterium]|nr:hypothetical protein [Chitinophagales bacterium]